MKDGYYTIFNGFEYKIEQRQCNNESLRFETVIITEDEVDSFLFEDLYEAKLDGKSISITGGREVKEPKLREGDSVVIYGVGDGYNMLYSYEKGLILGLPKNIESEKIPNIKMLYVAF